MVGAPSSGHVSLSGFRERSLSRGVNPLLYWSLQGDARAVLPRLLPHAADRHASTCRARGPLLLAANHRSFLDPFVIGDARAPARLLRGQARAVRAPPGMPGCLNSLGRLPGRSRRRRSRGDGDGAARSSSAATASCSSPRARACAPARSASRGAASGAWRSQTGAPVVPVAVIGTEDVRRGWRIRPRKVRIRVGRRAFVPDASSTPRRRSPPRSPSASGPCVSLQWDWLGGVGATRGARAIARGTRAPQARARGRPPREEVRAA